MRTPLVVVLAGGEGRRIGGAKPLRTLNGERLIDRAVRLGRLWSDDVRVALREPDQAPSLDLPVLLDDPEVAGPLAGLGSALSAAHEAGKAFVLTIPCDVPFLPSDLGARLRAAIDRELVALAASGPDLHPACALWRIEALDRLPAYRATGRRSLIGFAETLGFAVADWTGDPFLNVNDEGQLAEARRRAASEIEHPDEGAGVDRGRPRH